MMSILWVLWIYRNRRAFDDVKGEEMEHLWERVRILGHLLPPKSIQFP